MRGCIPEPDICISTEVGVHRLPQHRNVPTCIVHGSRYTPASVDVRHYYLQSSFHGSRRSPASVDSHCMQRNHHSAEVGEHRLSRILDLMANSDPLAIPITILVLRSRIPYDDDR